MTICITRIESGGGCNEMEATDIGGSAEAQTNAARHKLSQSTVGPGCRHTRTRDSGERVLIVWHRYWGRRRGDMAATAKR